jgi:hypothetical protein
LHLSRALPRARNKNECSEPGSWQFWHPYGKKQHTVRRDLWSRHSNHGLRLRRHWNEFCRHIVYGLRRLLWRVQTRGEVLRLHHLKRMRTTTQIQGACQTQHCAMLSIVAVRGNNQVRRALPQVASAQHTQTPFGRKEDSNKGAHRGNEPGYFQNSTGSPGACACSGGPPARTGSRTVVAAASRGPSVARREGAREAHMRSAREAHMRTHARTARQTAFRRKHGRRARHATSRNM